MFLGLTALMWWKDYFSISAFIINVAIVVDFILIGGVFPYFERKKLATIQKRVGPKYVGLNGRLQFIADAIKLFLKDYFFVIKTKRYYFFLLPILLLIYNLFFIFNFVGLGNVFVYDVESNLIFMLIFTCISNILIFLTGYICRNKYTIMTSARSVTAFFINELLFTILACQFFCFGKSLAWGSYINVTDHNGWQIWLPIVPHLILLILLECNRVPFDFQEAESEMIMGYTNEYPGFLFGVYVLIEYLHIFIFSYFIVLVIF